MSASELRTAINANIDLMLSDPAQFQLEDLFGRSWKIANLLAQKVFHIVRSEANAFITSDSPVFQMTVNREGPSRIGGG